MNKHTVLLRGAAATLAASLVLGACSKTPEAPAMPAVPAQVADVDVTEHVKTALQRNEALQGFNITVLTTQGDVRLSGMVDTQAQIDTATQIARAAEGAHAVHDELTIKP